MLRDDRTIRFAVWPHLVTLEGPAVKLAAVLANLYNDPGLPRNQWVLGNSDGVSRRAMVQQLAREGTVIRRLGLAAQNSDVCDAIEARVRAAQVKCDVLHLPERGV